MSTDRNEQDGSPRVGAPNGSAAAWPSPERSGRRRKPGREAPRCRDRELGCLHYMARSAGLATARTDRITAPTPLDQPVEVEVAELVVSCLERAGVEYVFGIPGGAVEPLYNALARSARRGGPRAVVARHEAGAAYMADGYARETGRLGVCVSTSGPGATNLLTGVACARASNVP